VDDERKTTKEKNYALLHYRLYSIAKVASCEQVQIVITMTRIHVTMHPGK